MWIVGEDMPQETNRITLNGAVTDQHGLPVPNVHFDDHPNDVAMRDHAWAQGELLYEAVGATGAHRTPPYPSTHNLGTCADERAARATASSNPYGAGARRAEPVRLRRVGVHHRGGREPDAHHRRAGDPRRPSTSAARSAPAGSDAPLPPHGAGWRLSGS